MHNIFDKSALISLLFLLTLCLYPAQSEAAQAIQTEVVSGNIIQKFEDNAIKLDNGEMYQPSRAGLVVNAEIGEPISLRYVVESEGKNVFFEFAAGLNSLKKSQPAPVKRDNGPK